MTRYDVAILSDLRYPGGNSASIVAEVRAQAAAGLSTVLVHLPSPHLRHARPFQSRIVACLRDGLADLAHDDGEVTARVLLIRQPRIFTQEPATVPNIRAEHTIVVLNQPPGDESDDQRYYVFAEVPHWSMWIGAPLVIAAGLIILWREYRRYAAVPAPVVPNT